MANLEQATGVIHVIDAALFPTRSGRRARGGRRRAESRSASGALHRSQTASPRIAKVTWK
jgi:hypothetical protein